MCYITRTYLECERERYYIIISSKIHTQIHWDCKNDLDVYTNDENLQTFLAFYWFGYIYQSSYKKVLGFLLENFSYFYQLLCTHGSDKIYLIAFIVSMYNESRKW